MAGIAGGQCVRCANCLPYEIRFDKNRPKKEEIVSSGCKKSRHIFDASVKIYSGGGVLKSSQNHKKAVEKKMSNVSSLGQIFRRGAGQLFR